MINDDISVLFYNSDTYKKYKSVEVVKYDANSESLGEWEQVSECLDCFAF